MARRITRLQVIFLIVVFFLVFSICKRFYSTWQISSKRKIEHEKPVEPREDVVTTQLENLEQKAKQQIAVSGEKIRIKRKKGFNVFSAAVVLKKAKNHYGLYNYKKALEYARGASNIVDSLLQPAVGIYTVKRGDCLWNISRKHYKKGSNWYYIWKANEEKIPDFDRIYRGQEIFIPDFKQQNQS